MLNSVKQKRRKFFFHCLLKTTSKEKITVSTSFLTSQLSDFYPKRSFKRKCVLPKFMCANIKCDQLENILE